ncbi:YesL family protein [Bacillus alkalicellulosilyticus]|uniref:YesL family protein n=1 Tax=Alkalihalobacterium alkalicellulosilyticum TaxID=1912214 RepID=UPI000997346E|nr:YesL family protein [Bacillus alkalicellulosilyticus]
MQVSWMSSKFYRTCEWVWRVAYVNILWLFATLAGLVILGIVPATVAMFAVIRKWLIKDSDIPIFMTFISAFKREFVKSNLLALIFVAVGYVIYFNYTYLATIDGFGHMILLIGLLFAAFIYVIALLFIFPVFVHFDLKLLQYIKTAIIIGIVNPLALITLAISFVLLFFLFYYMPGLMPFFGPCLVGLVTMWCGSMAIERVERKQGMLLSKEEDNKQ